MLASYVGPDDCEPLRKANDEAMWWQPEHHELRVTVLSQAGLGNGFQVCITASLSVFVNVSTLLDALAD